ncbi:MAG: lamin tail domain-containing protein [Myxococcota bacterium]|nr:lamin tail domain-containing protein [Myxococcota bacterium]
MVTTTRALFTALLIGLLAAACGDGGTTGDTGTTSTDTSDSPTDSGGTTDVDDPAPDADDPTPDADDPTPDADDPAPDADDPTPDADDPGPSWPNVVINEIAADGAPEDWIELLNRSDETVDLGGWTLTDDDPEHVHAFADGHTLGAGAYLLLLRDDAGGFAFGLGGSDAVNLRAPDDTLVDSTEWVGGQSPKEHAWGRIPNGSGDFMTLETPTPGGPNASNTPQDCGNGSIELGEVCDGAALDDESCLTFDFASGQLGCAATCDAFDTSGCVAPSRLLVINEVTSTDDDRIELFNPSFGPVVITGWTVSDKSDVADEDTYVFGAGSVLAAGEYLVLTRDVDHTFGLGSGDNVRLRDGDGLLIDILDWPKGEAEISYCLIPNGGDTAQACEAQTFGASND